MRTRGLRRRYGRARTSVPNRADMIAALGLEPEGRKRGDKYAYTTAEYWRDIRTRHSEAHRRARKILGVPEPK